jgi:hypothetical protein
MTERAGRSDSGHSMLCPYGILLRQYEYELIAARNENRDAGLKSGATKGEPWALDLMTRTDGPGRGFRGRSKQRPYGMLLRQYASGSRKREQAPALQRNVATLNLELGGGESQKSRPFAKDSG